MASAADAMMVSWRGIHQLGGSPRVVKVLPSLMLTLEERALAFESLILSAEIAAGKAKA
jgi:hypothetical protein